MKVENTKNLVVSTDDHTMLINKDSPNQHPISSITGLQEELDSLNKSGVYVGTGDMPDGYNIQIDPSGTTTEVDDLKVDLSELYESLYNTTGHASEYTEMTLDDNKGRICVGIGTSSFPDGKVLNDGTDTSYHYVVINIEPNKFYKISRSYCSNKVANYALYDSDGNMLSIFPTGAVGVSNISDVEIPIVEGATVIKVCNHSTKPIVYTCEVTTEKTFDFSNVEQSFESVTKDNISNSVAVRKYVVDGDKKSTLITYNSDKYPPFPIWGGEYLEHWYERIYDGTESVRVDFEGDSITQGYTGDNVYIGMRDDAIKKIMANGGYNLSLLTVNNNGVGGTSTNEWVGRIEYFKDSWKSEQYYTQYANGMLDFGMKNNPDIMIIGFGMNDANIDTTNLNLQQRLALFETNLREGLDRIRGNVPINGRPAYNKSVDDLSIILTTPTNTAIVSNDGARLYQNWQMYTKEIIMKLCREYKCAFADFTALTYGYTDSTFKSCWQSKDGSITSLHPNKYQVFYWMSALSDLVYPVAMHNVSIS